MPDRRPLVGYFLYAIPAHLLISVLANEPALFAAAILATGGDKKVKKALDAFRSNQTATVLNAKLP